MRRAKPRGWLRFFARRPGSEMAEGSSAVAGGDGGLLALLRCPICQASVEVSPDRIECPNHSFPVKGGIPRLLPPDLMASRRSDSDCVRARTYRSFGFEWSHFARQLPEYRRNFQWYMEPLADAPLLGRRVLDAGCGMGTAYCPFLAGRCGRRGARCQPGDRSCGSERARYDRIVPAGGRFEAAPGRSMLRSRLLPRRAPSHRGFSQGSRRARAGDSPRWLASRLSLPRSKRNKSLARMAARRGERRSPVDYADATSAAPSDDVAILDDRVLSLSDTGKVPGRRAILRNDLAGSSSGAIRRLPIPCLLERSVRSVFCSAREALSAFRGRADARSGGPRRR